MPFLEKKAFVSLGSVYWLCFEDRLLDWADLTYHLPTFTFVKVNTSQPNCEQFGGARLFFNLSLRVAESLAHNLLFLKSSYIWVFLVGE